MTRREHDPRDAEGQTHELTDEEVIRRLSDAFVDLRETMDDTDAAYAVSVAYDHVVNDGRPQFNE